MSAFKAFLDPKLKEKTAKPKPLGFSLTPSFLSSIYLYQFRAYGRMTAKFQDNPVHVITGPNGAGKTSILEAISLLLPGKGIRGADTDDLVKSGHQAFALRFTFNTDQNIPLSLHTSFAENMRHFKINDEVLSAPSDLYKFFSIHGLTPQMDKFFISEPAFRRKFFDKLVFSFYPQLMDVNQLHLKTLKAWSFHLKLEKNDTVYLDTLEKTLSETGTELTKYRLETLKRLTPYLQNSLDDFPSASLSFSGFSDSFLSSDSLISSYILARKTYPILKGLSLPHLMTPEIFNNTLKLKANLCSTGEQKSLLVSLLFSQISCIKRELNRTSILLLDDTTAHLDEQRQKTLYSRLLDIKALAFLSGTEQGLFKGFDTAAHYTLTNGELKNR